ncbi:substrate-binding domain-containing protein [Actinokineospora iranica]|uniref:ABC-type phosphate transport system, substrate-binding protein n=1 Tax=Actinokineospora iranica TaxID=1271860 RepID=A0A1G6K598_9PSEU|nr:substrate-binding domain-containing protein [Actinokineospora iranica]SDC26180.1 ABC-type phosphate transport system, substrate-binding protein [Actinokineospora iranica]
MDLDLFAFILALIGVAIPIFAFFWEFVLVRRKRLGYRMQMDTSALDEIGTGHAGILAAMTQKDGKPLTDPSFVLVRIENDGVTAIDESDYQVLADVKAGVRIRFPGRKVAGMVVTELSDRKLGNNFGKESGLDTGQETSDADGTTGIIDLPKVPLNPGDHYKVLAILERVGKPGEPRVEVGIKGGVAKETESRTGTPRRASLLMVFMAVIILALGGVIWFSPGTPLDCATGKLRLVGSTAFEQVMREAAKSYADTCGSAEFDFDFHGSTAGLQKLAEAGENSEKTPEMVSFTDGAKDDTQPMLLPRPVAFLLFTMVANKEAGVADLTLDQVRRLYAGQISNWKEIGGRDVPVVLVSRKPGSGTRGTFQRQVLDGKREPATNSDNCRTQDSGGEPGVTRCEQDRTEDLLDIVAEVPGAIGYAEFGAASGRAKDVTAVRMAGQEAALNAAVHGAYPFWETEYAYTYGEPPANSLTASFLRYLTNQVGKDIIRSHGNRPCDELQNPVLCRPAT